MSDDKNTGERLAAIESLLTSQKEGQDRIERGLEKTRDELSARHTAQEKTMSDLNSTVQKVDHRSRTDSNRIDQLEKTVASKIDRAEAVSKLEFEPIKELLKRLDGHMTWVVRLVIGAVAITVIGGGALIAKPWSERPINP